jgi:hypothetical protein
MFDYDSVWSYQVTKEVANGNFSNLFSHRSPSLYLFYAVFVNNIPNYHWLIIINMLFNIGAVLLFSYWIHQKLHLDKILTPFLVLFIGSCFYMVHASRLFSYDNASVFFIVCSIIFLSNYLEKRHKNQIYLASLCFSIAFTFNYKTIILAPVFGIAFLLLNTEKINWKEISVSITLFPLICLLYCVLGLLLGIPIYVYPLSFFGFLLSDELNAANHAGFFSFDFDYYLKYIFWYESPVILLGLLISPVVLRWKKNEANNSIKLLFIIGYAFFLLMHFAIKAPRGISFIYPIIYFFVLYSITHLLKNKWLIIAFIVFHSLYLGYNTHKNIYRHSQTNFQLVADYLKENNIKAIGTTLGINIIPFVEKDNVSVFPIFRPSDFEKIKNNNIEYVLVDDYYKIAGATDLDFITNFPVIFETQEPTMQYPMQFLEHAEFNGKKYSEIEAEINKAKNYKLRVVKIN